MKTMTLEEEEEKPKRKRKSKEIEEEQEEKKGKKKGNKKVRIVCPICGKPTNVSILHLSGVLRYTLRCRSCKGESEVEIKDIK